MKQLTAIHYVRAGGRLYTPGEVIPAGVLTAQEERRLMQKGAVWDADAWTSAQEPLEATERAEEAPGDEEAELGEEDAERAAQALMGDLVTKDTGRRKRR